MASINILVIGSGGREAALILAISKSKIRHRLFCIGGHLNPLISDITGPDNHFIVPLSDVNFCVDMIKNISPTLCIVGPEIPLAKGLVDAISAIGKTNPNSSPIMCVGFPQALALIESDKSWCRKFLELHGMKRYCPDYEIFRPREIDKVLVTLQEFQVKHGGFVIKPSGLSSGKGVKVSGDHFTTLTEGFEYACEILNSGQSIVVEEKLIGEEFSLMSLTNGTNTYDFPVVQDFKRAFDGDIGPNTGGMGCICSANVHLKFSSVIPEASRVNAEVATQLSKMSNFDAGVLFGGFMKTKNGLKVLEYNCRFGDPEVIAALASLDPSVDVLRIFLQVATGHCGGNSISEQLLCVRPSCVVYVVPEEYPEKSHHRNIQLQSLSAHAASRNLTVIPAGISLASSRTLAIVDNSSDSAAINEFLERMQLKQSGFRWRTDINERSRPIAPKMIKTTAEQPMTVEPTTAPTTAPTAPTAYEVAGVNIDAKMAAIESIQSTIRSTHHSNVIDIPNGFGGLCRVPGTDVILVNSTDSVGSKTELITQLIKLSHSFEKKALIKGLGHDIVNHCVNDILVMGCTKPLTFLDYIASHTLNGKMLKLILEGMAEACQKVGCAIVGGETAEIKDTYKPGAVDIAGFITGTMNASELLLPRTTLEIGDIVLAIPSVSAHTNGYTLINKLYREEIARNTIQTISVYDPPEKFQTVSSPNRDWFLRLARPHKCYLEDILTLQQNSVQIKGLVHITGGGLVDNPPRILPQELSFALSRNAIDKNMSDDFVELWKKSGIVSHVEMYKTFNSGIGMLVVVRPRDFGAVLKLIKGSFIVGHVKKGNGKVVFE